MKKQQREELQDKARHFNGMFVRWYKAKSPENYTELEAALDALCSYWTEMKSDQT